MPGETCIGPDLRDTRPGGPVARLTPQARKGELGFYFKVHMKRIFTVAFHFIIVKINIKESYIRGI